MLDHAGENVSNKRRNCVFLVHPGSSGLWAVRIQRPDESCRGLQEGRSRLKCLTHLAVI